LSNNVYKRTTPPQQNFWSATEIMMNDWKKWQAFNFYDISNSCVVFPICCAAPIISICSLFSKQMRARNMKLAWSSVVAKPVSSFIAFRKKFSKTIGEYAAATNAIWIYSKRIKHYEQKFVFDAFSSFLYSFYSFWS